MGHALIHMLDEGGVVVKKELYLDSLIIQIQKVATSIIHNNQHLEFHA